MKNWWVIALTGLIYSTLGLALLTMPENGLVTLAVYIGLAALVSGLGLVYTAHGDKDSTISWGFFLLMGILDSVLGLILLIDPSITLDAIPIVIGFWTIARGGIDIVKAFNFKDFGFNHWWTGLIGGLSLGILGYLVLRHTAMDQLYVPTFTGTAFIAIGVYSIFSGINVRKVKKGLLKTLEDLTP